MDGLRPAIRRFDGWLSRVERVEPFTDDPLVILRLQTGRPGWQIPLPDGPLPPEADVLFIHLWNERIPPIPAEGPDLAWARHLQRFLIHSFKAVARHLLEDSGLDGMRAVGGVVAQVRLGESDGGRAFLERLGFSLFPYHRPAGAFGEFWENFFSWWLMWTYNPPSARIHPMLGIRRSEFWMSRDKFLGRFG